MPTPRSAEEWRWFQQQWHRDLAERQLRLERYMPEFFSAIRRRFFRQRPHTDDMMQMCVDLGIDVPDFQPVSWDGLTFRLPGAARDPDLPITITKWGTQYDIDTRSA